MSPKPARRCRWRSAARRGCCWPKISAACSTIPIDLEARTGMQLGAAFAGLAIENSMLGATHALANPLTARYGIVHGQAIGLMLPHVIRFNGARVRRVVSRLARRHGRRQRISAPRRAAPAVWPNSSPSWSARRACRRGCRSAASSASSLARIGGRCRQAMDRQIQSPRRRRNGTTGPVRNGVLNSGVFIAVGVSVRKCRKHEFRPC